MIDKTDASGLVGQGENIAFDEEGKIKELPAVLEKRIAEFIKWANVEKAYEFLHGQEEHASLVIAGTEETPAPYNDIAIAIEKAHNDVSIMVVCKVFNTDTNEYMEESKILTIKVPKDELNGVIKIEEEE